jgi:hypothetical protein
VPLCCNLAAHDYGFNKKMVTLKAQDIFIDLKFQKNIVLHIQLAIHHAHLPENAMHFKKAKFYHETHEYCTIHCSDKYIPKTLNPKTLNPLF